MVQRRGKQSAKPKTVKTRTVPIGVWQRIGIVALIVFAVAATVFLLKDPVMRWFFRPTGSRLEAGSQEGWSEVEVVASGLDTPWSLAFLPGGDTLVTERNGQLQRIGTEGNSYKVSGVRETSEGGLLGVAIHPNFTTNNWLYLYYTTEQNGQMTNLVERYTLSGDALIEPVVILQGIPAAANHNGGSIAFGPDGKLYVTTGDAMQGELAQDTQSLAGKILRLNDDGTAAADNPFGNLVWSYGHRNPQGIAWDRGGRMWSVEHGPSGERKGNGKDELNLIQRGGNYGWPVIAGDETREGMFSPVAHSGENETWAPAGIAAWGETLFFAGLRGQTLYEAHIGADGTADITRHFTEQYGRLRAVASLGDTLYFTSSNRDGRGDPRSGGDKIYRFNF